MILSALRADPGASRGSLTPWCDGVRRPFVFLHYVVPPPRILLKQAAGLAKGAAVPNREKVGRVTTEQLKQIAETKQADLNAISVEAAIRIIAGTARSMGVEVVD